MRQTALILNSVSLRLLNAIQKLEPGGILTLARYLTVTDVMIASYDTFGVYNPGISMFYNFGEKNISSLKSHFFLCILWKYLLPTYTCPTFLFFFKFFWNLPLLIYDVAIQGDATSPNSKLPDVIYQVRLEIGYEISNEYTHTQC